MGVTLLSESERTTHLEPLLSEGWKKTENRDAIIKTFLFENFCQAWGFMGAIALKSEKMDHHPEWFNVYNKVEVTWSTHTVNGLSMNDISMANYCEEVGKKFQ